MKHDNELPILMSGPMSLALDAGTKWETRRLQGLERVNDEPHNWDFVTMKVTHGVTQAILKRRFVTPNAFNCPYGRHGTVLWVRENWAVEPKFNAYKPADLTGLLPADYVIWWGCDGPYPENAGRGRASMHLPRDLCRRFLKVTGIGVERLHAITEQGAAHEGVAKATAVDRREYVVDGVLNPLSHKAAYRALWADLNGVESWNANPWVWVVKFEPIIDYIYG